MYAAVESAGSLTEWVSESICTDCGSVLTLGINCRVRLKHRSSRNKKSAKYRNEVVSDVVSLVFVRERYQFTLSHLENAVIFAASLMFDRKAVSSTLATLSRFCIPPRSRLFDEVMLRYRRIILQVGEIEGD